MSNDIHSDIRKQARKMDIQEPTVETIKKNMYVPTSEDIEKDSKGVEKLMKEV